MRPELAHLFTRPFWLDEWHTALVADRATLSQLFSDLYHASDMGPPLLHLIAWFVDKAAGGLTPLAARIVSLTSVLVAVVVVFAVLRRRFGATAAVAGALALASHHMVVFHAFEFRYYGLWMALAALVAWAFGLDHDRAVSRRRDVTIALLSILLVWAHWLAAASLGLLCLGAMASFGRDWRAGFRRVLPAAAGFIAIALSLPLLTAQRRAVVEKSWMADVVLGDVFDVLRIYWAGTALILGVLIVLVCLVVEETKGAARGSVTTALRDPSHAALLSLLGMPVVMAVLSLRYPAMHDRYSIVALLAWPPVVAVAMQSLAAPVRGAARAVLLVPKVLVFVLLLFFLWASGLNAAVQASLMVFNVDASRKAFAQACGMGLPVVFQTRHLMYPATEGFAPRWSRCDARLLAVGNTTLDSMFARRHSMPRFFRFENEIGRLHERLYGFPRVASQAALDSVPRFILVGWDDSFPLDYKDVARFGNAVFPRHSVTRINEDLALVERR